MVFFHQVRCGARCSVESVLNLRLSLEEGDGLGVGVPLGVAHKASPELAVRVAHAVVDAGGPVDACAEEVPLNLEGVPVDVLVHGVEGALLAPEGGPPLLVLSGDDVELVEVGAVLEERDGKLEGLLGSLIEELLLVFVEVLHGLAPHEEGLVVVLDAFLELVVHVDAVGSAVVAAEELSHLVPVAVAVDVLLEECKQGHSCDFKNEL